MHVVGFFSLVRLVSHSELTGLVNCQHVFPGPVMMRGKVLLLSLEMKLQLVLCQSPGDLPSQGSGQEPRLMLGYQLLLRP